MLLLCKTASQLDCTAAFTPMQIAFHPEAHRVSTSPQQACLRQIISAVPCCCCAKQPFSRTALLHLHLCRLPFTQRRIESAPAHSNHAWDRLNFLCHAAAVQNSPTAGLHCCVYTYADCLLHCGALSWHQPTATKPGKDYICCAMLLLCKTALQQDCTAAFTPMQIAFHPEAHRVSTSPQQACLRQIISAVPCCCCAKQPYSWTALLRLHLCRLPFTLRHFELASTHSNQAWERLYLLCHAAAVQNSPSAGLHCCIYTYADCLSPRGASSQHQPTASMPETDYICCAMLLLCKTALKQDCTAAFTPMQIAFHPEAHRVSTSPQQACLRQIISAVPCCCCAKQPFSRTALLRLHLCRLPFTQRRIESAPAHSKHA